MPTAAPARVGWRDADAATATKSPTRFGTSGFLCVAPAGGSPQAGGSTSAYFVENL